MDQTRKNNNVFSDPSVVRQTSMGTLIMWNISKAVKTNPLLDIQAAVRTSYERLLSKASDNRNTENPEDQYLMCAILAWQRLGHSGCDSLYQFIETKLKKERQATEKNKEKERSQAFEKNKRLCPGSFISYNDSSYSNDRNLPYYDSVGPVVKLPLETKIVMRVDKCDTCAPKSKKKPDKVLMEKIDAACCMESACLERLAKLDKETSELRTRAQQLARREAQRVELLERAEASWKDLEMGYQRRLAAASEKEEDINKHIQKLIQERNGFKNACTSLAQELKEKGDAAEKKQALLATLDKEVCTSACERLHLSEEAARLDAELAELQCKSTQLDRELQFKEEQIRGRLQNMENEVDCARALTYEAERTIHAELSALRDQLATVSEQLLEEDENNGLIKEELEELRREKMELVEDLEGCQDLCSKGTQKKVDALNKMREQLKELKEKVMECQCKLPVDEAVEVKRTPSLVALCKCLPNEKFSESCSCTSLRTTLLTNLLSDLFSGLQSELGSCCTQMPCQLLKCLEDKHNWEKAGVIKNNLQSYFSKLLIGELNIAIATSIEKYHARWVGASCADAVRRQTTTCCPADINTIPDRVSCQVEKRAQKLAAKLAEKLFQERADELTAKAREVLKTGPPPCDCSSGRTAAVYPCFVKQPNIGSAQSTACGGSVVTSAHWRRTHQNVSQLKAQLEDLKKDSIKKEDLKMMEDNIVKIVQRSITETTTDDYATMNQLVTQNTKTTKKAKSSVPRSANTDQFIKRSPTKLNSIKKKQLDLSHPKQAKKNILLGLHMGKPDKPSKQLCPSYAVNLCLCGVQREYTKKKQNLDEFQYHNSKKSHQGLVINDIFPKPPNVKQTKPIVKHMHSDDINGKKKNSTDRPYCRSDVACFHKPPSNTSIDNLLGTLARWKCDLFNLNKSDKYKICDDGINEKPINENKNEVIDEKVVQDVSLETTLKVSAKTSINKSELHFVKEDVVKVSGGTELQNDLPVVNTDSEYMGAINLEKSNENFCKCIIDTENLSKSPYKCLNSAACNCYLGSKNEQEVKDRTKSKDTPENVKLVSEFKQPNMPQKENEDENNFEKQQMASPKENIYDHDISNISKTSPLFAANSEYCITFLGVTLKNNNPGKDFIGKDKACYNIQQTTHKRDKKFMKQAEKPFDSSSKKEPKITDQCNGDDIKSPHHLDPFDRNNKLNEFKSLINNLMSKQHENTHKNEDKALDTSSLKKSEKTSCVCCNANKIDDSSDLEVNAFHLLKEHLRNKLEEFKITTCKSDCISPSEEETLFSTILQRVRQVISENTLNVACKCVNEEPSEGSWNRAYILLQEYLKIKMKRVQCLCQSHENTESAVLPDVLEKVCNLIDDDFKRLKSLCKCKVIKFRTDKNLDYSAQNELPEKDTNVNNHINNSSYVKGTSIVSILPLKTTTSLVSSDQKVNTSPYSTDYKKNVDTTTSHHSGNNLKKCVYLNQNNLKKSHTEFGTQMVTNYCINVAEQTMSTTTEFNKTTDLITDLDETDFLGKANENSKYDANRITNFPYIGYTIDCSCNGILGECSCYKSLSKNTDNINSIWSAVTSNKLNVKKHSYIMNAVPAKTNSITELTVKSKTGPEKKSKTGPEKSRKKVFCNATISALDNEDITLKFSKDKLRKSRIPSTTTTYVTSKDDASLEAEEPIDWCDCSSTKTKSHKAHDVSDGTWSGSLYYPINNLMNRKRTLAKDKSDPIHLSRSLPSNCECSLVPMCHVKMLVENIEKRLFQSKCTCDSLCPTVCPEHSNKNVEK